MEKFGRSRFPRTGSVPISAVDGDFVVGLLRNLCKTVTSLGIAL